MNTTAILVEILIVGIQGSVWLTLIILSIFGCGWVTPVVQAVKGWEIILSFISLSVFYTVGIFLDRVADVLFVLLNPESKLLQYKWVSHKAEVAHADPRMGVFAKENRAADFLENIRIRLRIARATVLNVPLITISAIIFLASRTNHASSLILFFVFLTGALVTFLCLLFLGVMQVTYTKRLKQTIISK